ncbi:hypothetical protein BRC61_04550 [Halobacteriales archaeon QH_10_65_19]|jgi:hypothetical protein|nr:MAG: hypothetical protein BRC61_04550 [Halobacteriales archaeon QH_10_65_19]
MNRIRHTVERFRQPEYTGRNRCLPCTAVNAVLAGALAAVVGVSWRPVGGLLVLGISVAAIYLRGYLVPGTPELTQRYFPDRVLRAFGKDVAAHDAATQGSAVDATDADDTGTEELLSSAGVVEPCADEDDLCLTDEFSDVWWRRIRQFRADDERAAGHLATVLDVDPAALSFVDEDQFGVTYEGDLIAEWTSDAAFYADLAAEPTLAECLGNWDALGDRQRTELLAGLRAFLQECPVCEADLEQVEDVRKSCCTGDVVSVSVDCGSCGARVFSGSYR